MTIVIPGMVTLSLISLFYCSMLPETGRKARMQAFEQQYIAHRGFHDNRSECPENSLPAFERAIEMGYGIELDVQLTKDGVPVVFHDWDLKRAAGVDRKIRDCTFEELQSYRLFGSSQTVSTASNRSVRWHLAGLSATVRIFCADSLRPITAARA